MSPTRVWIDTDPAVGVPERDVDDGFALLQALRSAELEVVGVSTVFGNTDLERAYAIAAELLHLAGHDEMPLHPGAADAGALGAPSAASRAMVRALERSPLVVLALGPLTNVATALRDPAAAAHVERVVAVAGRRPGQRFQVGTGEDALPDLNFESDVPAAAELLAQADLELLLAPFEVSSHVRIGEPELRALEAGPSTARWLVPPSRRWLEHWREHFGVDWFHPFDTLAVAAVATPELIELEALEIAIVEAPGAELHAAPELPGGRPARYAHRPHPRFRDDLMARLLS
ncbi:MAG: nucleoside hydrolase [Solirubrobacteraceae bacterium]